MAVRERLKINPADGNGMELRANGPTERRAQAARREKRARGGRRGGEARRGEAVGGRDVGQGRGRKRKWAAAGGAKRAGGQRGKSGASVPGAASWRRDREGTIELQGPTANQRAERRGARHRLGITSRAGIGASQLFAISGRSVAHVMAGCR